MNPSYVASTTHAKPRNRGRVALRTTERQLLLFAGDYLGLLLSVYLAARFAPAGHPGSLNDSWWIWSAVVWCCWLLSGYSLGLYDPQSLVGPLRSSALGVVAVWIASGLYAIVARMLGHFYMGPEVLALPVVGSVIIGAWRWACVAICSIDALRTRCVIVGAGTGGTMLASVLRELEGDGRRSYSSYHVVGLIDDNPRKIGTVICGYEVLCGGAHLAALVAGAEIDEVILATGSTNAMNPHLLANILDCRERGALITSMGIVYERLTGKVAVEAAGLDPNVVLPYDRPPHHKLFLLSKRLVDLAAGLLGCVVVLLVCPLVLVLNRVGSRGPLFFFQDRIGYGGRPFKLVKFRSMVPDAEKNGWQWSKDGDSRITPVGTLLRKTRLDELPQFWNVLLGHMSLIGPRPERREAIDLIEQTVPFYRTRHAVRPGITGWAQVRYRYGANVDDSLIKLQYDLYYIKRLSMALDVQIAIRTIVTIITCRGQ